LLRRGAWALMISFGHGFATAPMSGKVAGYVALRPPAWFLAVEGPQAAYGAEVWVGLAS